MSSYPTCVLRVRLCRGEVAMRARDGLPGPDLWFELFRLLVLARMWLLLAWFGRALMLRRRLLCRLSRSRLRGRPSCGLRPLRCLGRTALGCRSGFGTRLLRRFRGMLDRCRLALRSDRSCWPGCRSGSGLVDGFWSWASFGSWPRGCGLCLIGRFWSWSGFIDGFWNWARFGSWSRGCGPCLRLWNRLLFIHRPCGRGFRLVDWFRSWPRLSNGPRSRFSSRYRARLACVHWLCTVCRNRVI